MRHAVILAHPDPESFNAFVARTYVETAVALSQTASLRDLYRLDFDPRLGADELPWRSGGQPRADVLAEREVIAAADVIAFVYPLWFNAPPAMMKGYVDRVFGMGFAYGAAAPGTRPLLAGKRLVTISTSGAPDEWVEQTGAVTRLRAAFDDHVAAVCGLSVIEHLNLGGATPGIRKDAAEDMLQEVVAMVRRLFGPPVAATVS
jgi:NAD(P)H dehydrogenase (quinone)